MRDFITCLEFLTRVRFSKRTDWRDEDFSRSVPYFPLVGLVIGAFLAAVNYGLFYIETPLFLRVTLLLLAEIIITGGLMYDGFMDTADGVFSARSRERMLEIMKDSHVGSNAVLAIIILVLLKIAAYLELDGATLTWVLLTMSVATRTFMVVFIVNFPYARKEGIGHMFTKYAKPVYTYIAFAVCAAVIAACSWQYLAVAGICFAFTLMLAQYLKTQLGGLTGDTYGALTECGNVIYLLTAVFLLR
ncbi:MAG: adenosylcobinamide-GDP ribazoletransferase [Phascolarctobacterium sp.]|uniref:adenosylcobinamide-GDP ribazoletransferase n=1 Tax=Phascolarctobacterium sp. TaxID=2049039 RepID=UPI0025D49B90|nr:adenosylcobinamide-GDP ribazoletransferase [Phascolarctobacterium sp.]MCC8158979.1 adenosylcobinamide-GDP ribazoletransferase [Phascolarctobacterium sp.]